MQISESVRRLPRTAVVRLLHLARKRKDIISLGLGEPDFPTPAFIREAAKRALDNGKTSYSPASGLAELREQIVHKLQKDNGIHVDEDQVIVTCGSIEAIWLALVCLVDPGDRVLIPDPGFLAYVPMIKLLNACPVSVQLKQEERWQLLQARIKACLNKRTKILVINTPANPTGAVLDRNVLEEIADLAVEHDLLIISDEAYEHFLYGTEHISIGALNGMGDRVVTFQSFSKTFAMPGFRIGYAAGPREIIQKMIDIHPWTTLSAPTFCQLAAAEALRNRRKGMLAIKRMHAEYDRRRKLVMKRLQEIPGFTTDEPLGAFYFFPKFHFRISSIEFAEFLLKEARVIVIPGSEFGRYGEGFIRISYATSYDKIENAMVRIENAVKKLKQ